MICTAWVCDQAMAALAHAGKGRPFGHLENALADDRQVLISLEAALEAPRTDGGGNDVLFLLGAHGHGRPGGNLVAGLDVLLGIGDKLQRRGGIDLFGLVHAAGTLPFLVGHQADHLAHRAEARAVEKHFVARLDPRAAVGRVVAGHGVFHFQALHFPLFLPSRCFPTPAGRPSSPPSRTYSSSGQGWRMPGGDQGPRGE